MRYGIKEVADLIFINLETNKPELFMDTAKMTNLELTAETTYARGGRGNGRLIGWDYNREGQLQVEDALLSDKSLAMLAGSDVEEGTKTVLLTKKAKLGADGKIAVADADSIVAVHLLADGASGEDVDASATDGYAFATGEVTLAGASKVEGADYIVYYNKEVENATTITFSTDKFPATYRVVGNTLVRNEKTGKDHAYQMVIARAKLLPGVTLTMDAENLSTFTFTLDVLQDDNKEMVELIRF